MLTQGVWVWTWQMIKKQALPNLVTLVCFELLIRLELTTSSLPRKCSTTELQQHSTPFERCKSMKQIPIDQTFFDYFFALANVKIG